MSFRTPLLRSPRAVVGALAALALTATVLPASAADPAVPAPPTSVAVRVAIDTTSDWTAVQLGVPWLVDYRVRSTSAGTTVAPTSNGWVLKAPTGGGSATIDAVFTLPDGDIPVRIQKGSVGQTTATITAGTARPVTVANALQASPAETWGALPRSSALAGRFPPKRADDRRLVLAFYYPWFANYGNPALTDRPADPRPTTTFDGVLSLTAQARAHGVDGFLVSWQSEAHTGAAYDLAVRAAERTGSLVAPYLEVGALANARPGDEAGLVADVTASLRAALTRSGSPAVLRSGGVPVVFAFAMTRLSPTGWAKVTADLAAAGTPIRLVGDTAGAYYASEFGVHQYNASSSIADLAKHWQGVATQQRAMDHLDGSAHLVTATVQPGWDDSLLRGDANPVIPRDGGARYESTWDAALSSDPDWVLVTSWNEWFEGTSIEPGVLAGDQSLLQTAARAAAWRGATIGSGTPTPTPSASPSPTASPSPAASPSPTGSPARASRPRSGPLAERTVPDLNRRSAGGGRGHTGH